jgi:hypothetical protein
VRQDLAGGGKRFFWGRDRRSYRNAGGRSRRLTISGHGRLTADEARDQAKQRNLLPLPGPT